MLLAAFGIRFAYIENTPYKAINDAGTYNRLASMVAPYRGLPHRHGARLGRRAARGARPPTSRPASPTSWPRWT